jgi:hypothetical protein
MKYIPKENKLHYTAELILIAESSGVPQNATQVAYYGPLTTVSSFKNNEGLRESGFASWNLLSWSYNLIQWGHAFFCSFCAAHNPTLHNCITIIRVCCYNAVITCYMLC